MDRKTTTGGLTMGPSSRRLAPAAGTLDEGGTNPGVRALKGVSS